MRGQGRVYRKSREGPAADVWWLDYSIGGKRYRESSGTTVQRDALKKLRERIGKRVDGTLTGRPEKVTLKQLKEALQQRYLLKGRDTWGRAEQAFSHLADFFGDHARAVDITRARVSAYQAKRLEKDGAARNTIRYETGVLNAAFAAAIETDLLASKPVFPKLGEGDKRSGFFEPADFAAVVVELPPALGELARFARMTGWRRSECTGLTWAQVDWDDARFPGDHDEPVAGPNACIRIDEADTKGNDAREFPIAAAPELRELLLARWRQRAGVLVFHRTLTRGKRAKVTGQPIGDFRTAWNRACKNAGVPGRLFHDLRRTAARDFRRAGVSEGVIMRLCGWKTRDMFDRYNIIDRRDLDVAIAARFSASGTGAAPDQANEHASK